MSGRKKDHQDPKKIENIAICSNHISKWSRSMFAGQPNI